jgi:dolichol-phosphate mannosyltransferase
MPLTDATTGFKCWRREALQTIDLDQLGSNGYVFLAEMSYQAFCKKLRIIEVPIIFVERRLGRSKMNAGIIMEGLWASSACVFGVDLRRAFTGHRNSQVPSSTLGSGSFLQ